MDIGLRRSERSTAGTVPKRFDTFCVKLPNLRSEKMFRTPPSNVNRGQPSADPSCGNEGNRVDNSVGSVNADRRSRKSKSSKSSNSSQIRALELRNQIDEEELRVSLEQDRIEAELQLEALQIEKQLELKREQKKAEFLKKKREREMLMLELRSNSDMSSACSSSSRVHDWVKSVTSEKSVVTNHHLEAEDTGPELNPHPSTALNWNRQRSININPRCETMPTDTTWNRQPVFESNPTRDPVPTPAVSPEMTEVLSQAFKALQNRHVRELPTFSGNIMDWPIFENEFKTSTAEFKLNDRDNLRRLNSALQGKARKTVEALLSSAENVDLIMRMLKSNFGRTEWVVANRLDVLRNLEYVKDGNIESFRFFYNAVVGTAVALKNVGAEMYLMNPELIAHLAEKLPNFSKQMWIRHKADLLRKGELIDFQAFSRWLEDEMENQLASMNPIVASRKQTPNSKPKQPVLNVNNDDEEMKCPLCSANDHLSLAKCEKFRKFSVEQRRSAARSCKVCYVCLKSDHNRQKCQSNKTCSICDKNHHELVHSDDVPRQLPRKSDCKSQSAEDLCHVNAKSSNTLLRIGKVKIQSENGVHEVFALFDEGSSISMIDASLAATMGLTGPVQPVIYRWTNGITHKDDDSMTLSFGISGPSKQSKWYQLNNVRTIKGINLPSVNLDLEKIKQMYPLLDDDKLEAIQGAVPRILIGSNNAGLIVPLKTVQYSVRGLQLTRCHLGWTIHGEIEPTNTGSAEQFHILMCSETDDVELTTLVKQMFKVEDFGITRQDPKMSEEDERALDIMNRTLKRCGDRFEVGQLYKYNHFSFPDSKPQALRRLQTMEKKMDADPDFAEKYCQKMQEYLDKGYARKLAPEELEETPNTWYLPHFSVVSASKFRLVMDAKAKSHGFSLNDLLLKGPDFVPSLIAVLMRGRKKKIAFMADIKEMFHQVLIRLLDQNSQRFFWRGMDRDIAPEVYVMMVMIFGAVSSPSIAQFIKNFNAKELEEQLPGVQRAIVEQHYVDDYFDCADSEEEAVELIHRVIAAHDQGGFKLVKFRSNSEAVIQSVDPSLRADVDENQSDARILGLKWSLKTDEFIFSLDFPQLDESLRTGAVIPTKRELLKFMMSIFDPLNVLSPITVHLKIIFQELWRLQVGWDDQLPDGLVPKWKEWLEETTKLQEVRVPRYYFPGLSSFRSVELHAFCDASDKAFACVVYLVHRCGGKSHIALVLAKSKVAPLKAQTVPRLELQGCVLASQMVRTVQEELKLEITSTHFWTDSKICLGWLSTTEKLTAYVGSRVTKIKENGHHTSMWHWISSNLNVADLGTKSSKFPTVALWLNGPEFLHQPRSLWPITEDVVMTGDESVNFYVELENCPEENVMCLQTSVVGVPDLPDIKRFSDYNRLIRATAYYLKMRKILALSKNDKPKQFKIDVHDMTEAKEIWYRKVQQDVFSEEIRDLRTKGIVKKTSRLYTYSPFLHNGIIRMQGRIQTDGSAFEVNNPVILPDNHDFTNLLIRTYHISNCHQGLETVVNNLRQRYRILKMISQVKKTARLCMRCRELRSKPNVTQMGNLPPERTTAGVFSFCYTGIDYFGPLTVKVGRRLEKRWVVLFTCMTSRAVHIEVVPSLDTSSCIMAIRCFMAVRGIPKKILTDNGTNFTGANNELKNLVKQLDQPQIEETLSVRGVEWTFIPPGAPHFGGCWERLVRTVKTGLGAMLKERHPSDMVLRTALCEVMNVVNNRPLVHISDDPHDPEPLTPNMLLLGRSNYMQYDHHFDERDLDCRAAYKHSQVYADRFWRKWVSAYRPELMKRRKWQDNRDYHEYKTGDLVMIADESMHRGCWPKGLIERVFYGPDGKVRTVVVRTSQSTYTRPISKIVLLQVRSVLAPEDVEDTNSNILQSK